MKPSNLHPINVAGLQTVFKAMERPKTSELIVFTDLDGTLLDHETYSYEPAREALNALRKHQIPLILASSKTASEISPLRSELGFSHCEAIVENGAGILPQGSEPAHTNNTYLDLLDSLSEIPSEIRDQFTGFSQWSVEEVSDRTGLSLQASEYAKERQYSEPGIWSGTQNDLDKFVALLEKQNIKAQKGGRFLTLSFGANKSESMKEIVGKYRTGSRSLFSIALGDAPNDFKMLQAADLGILIPNPSNPIFPDAFPITAKEIVNAPFAGPKGWNSALLDVMNGGGLGEKIV